MLSGGASSSLSLDDVTATVFGSNPSIKEALNKWDAKKRRITQEAAWDDLRVSAMSRVARFVSVPPNAFTDETVSIEQAIPIAGKNRSRAKIAAAEAIATYEEARRQQLEGVTKARVAYFRLANAYAQIELNDKNLVSLRQIAEIGRSKYEVGTQSAADVLQAREIIALADVGEVPLIAKLERPQAIDHLDDILSCADGVMVARGDLGLEMPLEHVPRVQKDVTRRARARKIPRCLSQPFFVAQVFTGSEGKYVPLKETIRGFKMIVAGECDSLPEQAFYMVGTIDEAIEKAKKIN